MTLVKLKQLLVAQIRYVARFTPAVIVIGCGREQMLGHHLPEGVVRRAHCPFHFVIDDTFIKQVTVAVFQFGEFETVALLSEVQFM